MKPCMNRRSFVQAVVAAVTSAAGAAGATLDRAAPATLATTPLAQPENTSSVAEDANIKVVGLGGLGGKAVDFMLVNRVPGVDYIFADTEEELSRRRNLHKRIRLGGSSQNETRPSYGHAAAALAQGDIRKAVAGAHLLLIVAGMGGSTGTGAAPEIARVARNMGVHVVGIVTTPFSNEHDLRKINTTGGMTEFQASADSVIVVANDSLIDLAASPDPWSSVSGSFLSLASNLVQELAGILLEQGNVCIELEDVRTILGGHQQAYVGIGRASGDDRARLAARSAMTRSLPSDAAPTSMDGVLLIISASKGSLMLSETKAVMNSIRRVIGPAPLIFYGTRYDDTLGDAIRVTLITSRNVSSSPARISLARGVTAPTPK